jgi:DNA-binding CsgD family transcriptional regulator/tetratricopeptide (TPR) repeat protein
LTAGHVDLRERVTELEQIERLLDDVLAREGRALLVQGQAGIGKTALLEVARRHAGDRRIAVLTARGGELEGHFPFGVARQLFEPVLLHASPDVRSELLTGAAGLATPVVESAVDPEPAPLGDAFSVLHGLHWLTVNLSTRCPVLILVDDLHWADAGSLRFLLYLAARLDGLPCAVIGAMRPVEPAAPAPALETRMLIDRLFEVVAPAALSERAVRDVLAAGLGSDPDPTFVSAAAQATGGVPFLLQELVAALAEESVSPSAEEAPRVPRLGPHAVAQATLVRLARMPAGCVPLTRAVAVLGGDAHLGRVTQLAELEESDALDALDALVGAGLVRVNGRIEFVHPILRAAIYDALAPGERSRLHHRAADLLAVEGVELDAVAAQLLPSEPIGSQHVIDQLRQAAASALDRAAPEDSIAYLTRALDEGCPREVRAAILFDLGRAARLNTDAAMFEYFAEARKLAKDPTLRGQAAFELATALGLKGEWDEAMSLLDDALDELGDDDHELAMRLEGYRAAITVSFPHLVAGFDDRLPMLQERVERGGRETRALALLLASNAVWRAADESWSVALAERGWDDGHFLEAGADLWSLGQGMQALVISGELDQAREVADAVFLDGRLRGSMARFVLASAYRGWIDAREGHLTAAEGKLRPAIDRVRAPHARYSLCTYLWLASEVVVERPQCADLVDLAEGLDFAQMAGGLIEALLREARGRVRHAVGNTRAGLEDLRRAETIFRKLGIRNPNGSCWRSTLALMLDPDARDEAVSLASDELEDARGVGQPRGIGVALRTLGVLQSDRGLLEEAVTVLERSPARLEHARALIELGATLRRAGDRAACRAPLRAGLDMALAGGAVRLGERARVELESSGARLRRERISGRDALTPSELRVARLAAEGRTNNEVAQALFVTPKTIDTHLSRVYSKLGISSRRALSAALEGVATSVAR